MNGPVKTFWVAIACSGLLFGLLGSKCPAQQTNNQALMIKTNFVKDAILSDKEVKQVLELARQCGIERPAVLETFRFTTSSPKEIRVKSVEWVDDRDTLFETILIEKDSWRKDYVLGKDLKRVGEFWAKPCMKYKICHRSYEFRKQAVQIKIENEIRQDVADKAIQLIAESKVRFKSDWVRDDFDKLTDVKPTVLRMNYHGKDYELEVRKSDGKVHDIRFRFEDGEVVIDSAAETFP